MAPDDYKPCGAVEHLLGRRQFMGDLLAGAGAAVVGSSLLASPVGAREVARRGKSVVVVYLSGGISQFESWDPKASLETGGPFKAIPTTVPGIQISELLPLTAQQMHRMAIVRSLNTKQDDHGIANNLVRSGRMTKSATEYPDLGAVVAKGLERADFPLPGHITTTLTGV
ncbi:MAG: DUF1501 domain-containing protein, partial [Gemmata sp.]